MQILTDFHVKIPPPVFVKREEPSGPFGRPITYDAVDELPATPPNGEWFEVFLLQQTAKSKPEPISPEHASRLIDSGQALLGDPEQAEADVTRLRDEALLGQGAAPYEAVIGAHYTRVRRERIDAVAAKLGIEPEDSRLPLGAPVLWTVAEVAEVLRVDERTVRRWSGTVLPAPVKLGGRVLYKAHAILNLLERSAA